MELVEFTASSGARYRELDWNPRPSLESEDCRLQTAHIGELATITGPTVSTVYASDSRGQPTFLNISKPYPDPGRFTVVIWEYDRDNFPFTPEEEYNNTTICATGLIETYEGIPQIVADTASDIKIIE